MYIQPGEVESPTIHESSYVEIARYLEYAPLFIKIGNIHSYMKANDEIPVGVLSVPESLAEQSEMNRLPDKKDFLIAKETGAMIMSKLFSGNALGDSL